MKACSEALERSGTCRATDPGEEVTMQDVLDRLRAAGPGEERYARAVSAWQRAEELAQAAERIAMRLREAARVAWTRAAERRQRASDACAARQVAFARGLIDAAAAHERAALDAEALAEDAERRARPLRGEAQLRLHEVGGLVRAARAAALEIDAGARRGAA
jgi:hypothetical protein